MIGRAAALGGLGAAYTVMQGLGLASTAFAEAAPSLPSSHGAGVSVLVLGAGIAGLVTAYELQKAGYDVTVIEARDRVGGRAWTVRDGSRVSLLGEADQTARLSKGLYFNAGPARIPSHHQGVLSYVRALNVPIEVEVNASRGALLQSDAAFGGAPIQQRQAVNDLRGQLSELLSKSLKRGSLDGDLTAEDRDRLIAFLKSYGDLDAGSLYRGSERSGYAIYPGALDQKGVARLPLPLSELLRHTGLGGILYEDNIVMQATMFEPVGGMDRIPQAIAGALRRPVALNLETVAIRQTPTQAQVTVRDRTTGKTRQLTADHLVATLPLPVLTQLDTDFSPPVKRAIAGARYDHASKVAFEAPRFWEDQQIYGGLSFPGGDTGLVWYPSSGFNTPTGVLVAAYLTGGPAKALQALPLSVQIAHARAAVERLHPGHGVDLTAPIVIDWNRVPFNLGPWIHWDSEGADPAAYHLLNQPAGRVLFSGAHLSQLPSWMEGGVAAARRTVSLVAERTRADRLVSAR